jgi:hypothetical protein
VNPLLRRTLHAEVSLLRMPLKALDDHVVSRFTAQDSKVRQTLHSALAVVDQAAGLLADQPAHRPAEHGPGVADDEAARAGDTTADTDTDVLVPGEPMPAEEQEEVEELAEELLEEQEQETFAGELADDEELRRVQAELQAKRMVEETVEDKASE